MSERFARGDYDQTHHFVAAPFQVHLFFAAAAKQIIGVPRGNRKSRACRPSTPSANAEIGGVFILRLRGQGALSGKGMPPLSAASSSIADLNLGNAWPRVRGRGG